LDLGRVQGAWAQILEAVKGRRRFTWMVLSGSDVRPVGVEGNAVLLGFSRPNEAKGFSNSGSDQVVAAAIQQVLGMEVRVAAAGSAVTASAAPARRAEPARPAEPAGWDAPAPEPARPSAPEPEAASGPEPAPAPGPAPTGPPPDRIVTGLQEPPPDPYEDAAAAPPPEYGDPSHNAEPARAPAPEPVRAPAPEPAPRRSGAEPPTAGAASTSAPGAGDASAPAAAPGPTGPGLIESELGGRIIEEIVHEAPDPSL
jgi:DNA polymerase-3 subunit gamma/tau